MATGARTTYTDTGNIKRSISEVISMIDWTEAPLLQLLGLDNASRFRLINWPNTKVEWNEDVMSTRTGTITPSVNNSTTSLAVTAGQGVYLRAGDVVRVDDELMYVSSVATDTATVIRGFAGSTAASHVDLSVWLLATNARIENGSYVTGHTTTVTAKSNYVQQLSEAISVSNDEMVNPSYGITDTLAYHLSKIIGGGTVGQKTKAGKLPILLEQTFYHGRKAVGSATTARSMGGFNEYVTTNVTNLSSVPLTQKHIEDKMQVCYEAGGTPNTILCGAWARRKISSFYGDSIRTTQADTTGGHTTDMMRTDFGDIEIVYDRWCPTNELYLIQPDKMGWLTFRPFDVVDMPITTDGIIKDVRGSFTFVLENELAHAKLYGFSTTA